MLSNEEIGKMKAKIDALITQEKYDDALWEIQFFAQMMVLVNVGKPVSDISTEDLRYCMGGYGVALEKLEEMERKGYSGGAIFIFAYAKDLLPIVREIYHRNSTPQNALFYLKFALPAYRHPDVFLQIPSNELDDYFIEIDNIAYMLISKFPNEEKIQFLFNEYKAAIDTTRMERIKWIVKDRGLGRKRKSIFNIFGWLKRR